MKFIRTALEPDNSLMVDISIIIPNFFLLKKKIPTNFTFNTITL